MRLLYAVHAYVPESVGGVELHAHRLASTLGRDHAVAVLAVHGDPSQPDYALEERRQDGVTVRRVNRRYSDIDSFAGTYRNERVDRIFEDLLDEWRPDVVHVQHLIGLSTGILERTKRHRLPLVLGLHDYWFGCPRGQRIRDGLVVCHDIDRRLCVPCLKPQNYEVRARRTPFGRWLRRLRPPTAARGLRILRDYDADMHRALALPDALVMPSEFHRDMYARYGIDATRVHVIPYGLPGIAPRASRPPGTPFRIGFLGTLIPSKGPHVLVEAYRLLARPDVALDVHGNWVPFHGDAGYLERLRAAAAAIPGDVRFHGRYEPADVAEILASFDALVVPSLWYESYSIVLREAFLAGVPVVASRHGAMAEAISHGENGLLFAPGDAADLATQLRRLIADRALWNRLATAPQRVSSIEENAARHLALYASLGAGTADEAIGSSPESRRGSRGIRKGR